MNINLYKYKQQSGEVINYFTQRYPDFVDYMQMTNIMNAGFPIFNEEYIKEDDVNVIKSGDYDLKFSLLQNDTSYLGKSIKEFLLPDDDRNFLLLCSFEFDGIERWGTVDITSIKANYTVTQNRYDISFTVYGLLKEFIEGMKTIDLFQGEPPDNNDNIPFNDYLQWHFRNVQWLTIDNQLDLDAICRFPVKVSEHLRFSLWYNGLNQGYSIWEGLKSFAVGLGFVLRLENISTEILFNPYRIYPRFKLVMFWRTLLGGTVKQVDVIEDEESNSLLFDKQYLMIKYNKIISNLYNPIFDIDLGILMNKNIIFMSDVSDVDKIFYRYDSAYPNQLWVNKPGGIDDLFIPLDYIQNLVLPLHAQNVITYSGYLSVQIPYCRILTLSGYSRPGFSSIIYNTAVNEYKFLLKGVNEKRKLKVSLINNNYKIFDTTIFQNKSYWINRIENMNLREKNTGIEAIRI